MIDNITEDAMYVQFYSHEICSAILGSCCQRWVNRRVPARHSPVTDGFEIPTPEDAGHALFMAAMRYYRASGNMPKEARDTLIALQRGIHDPHSCLSALNEALNYFVHSMASTQDAGVHKAVTMAQLSLKSLQDTYAEMPATTAQWKAERWVRD